MEWIYYVIAFFWLVSAFNKAKKKQQLEVEKKKQQARAGGVSHAKEIAKQPYRMATEEEILAIFQNRISEVRRIEHPVLEQNTIDYDIVSTYDNSSSRDEVSEREHSARSHFKLGKGMTTALSDMSHMPKGKEVVKSADFSLYSQKKTIRKQFIETTPDALRKYFIASEIFGKPKALRK